MKHTHVVLLMFMENEVCVFVLLLFMRARVYTSVFCCLCYTKYTRVCFVVACDNGV